MDLPIYLLETLSASGILSLVLAALTAGAWAGYALGTRRERNLAAALAANHFLRRSIQRELSRSAARR